MVRPGLQVSQDSQVRLNVGGQVFQTARATLTQAEGQYLPYRYCHLKVIFHMNTVMLRSFPYRCCHLVIWWIG